MIEQLNLTLWAWMESVRGLRRRQIYAPFVAVAVVQALLLLLLTQFYRPGLSWFMVPLLKGVSAEQVLHYPQLYLALPALFSRTGIWLDWLAGSFLFGAGFLLVWRLASHTATGSYWSDTWRSLPQLLLVRMPTFLFAVLLLFVMPAIFPAGESGLTGWTLRLVRYGTFLLGVCVEAAFIYGPLAVLVRRSNPGQALAETLRLAFRTPVATLLIVLIPNLTQIPVAAVLRRTDQVVKNLAPETVAWLVLGSIVLYALVNYLILASAVRVFGSRLETPEGGRS
jgi:hypothetical protein